MSPDRSWMVPLQRAPRDAATTWGPCYDTLHPPGKVHMMIAWKVVPTWMDYAERLWQQRQILRRAYEAVHGTDPAMWPTQHPGAVLDGYAVCLGCHWLFERGYYRLDRVFQYPVDLARHHETSNGTFRGAYDRLMPTARATPGPPPMETPPIPRRIGPIPPVRIVARYAAGRPRR
jgi:hypothetical protein